MSHIFNALSDLEIKRLKNAIPYITVLIAGADGHVDAKERAWAEKITGIRAYAEPEEYKGFYKDVGVDFQEKLDKIIATLPSDLPARETKISEELTQLNPILAKLEPKVAAQLYNEFKRFATHVAKSTGGFLGFFSVGAEEAKHIDLPMINEFVYDEEFEEEE